MDTEPTEQELPFKSDEEFFAEADNYVALQAKIDRLENKKEKAKQKLLDRHDKTILALNMELEESKAKCEEYAQTHRERLLPKKKSGETVQSIYGFYFDNPSLKTLPKWKWEKVLKVLKGYNKGAYVRRKETVDKEAILRKVPESRLARLGLRREQNERFFIKSKPAKKTN